MRLVDDEHFIAKVIVLRKQHMTQEAIAAELGVTQGTVSIILRKQGLGGHMPYTEVMPKFKKGELHSGSKKGPTVTKRKQAIAIMLSEKREADKGKKEYKPKK
jgi:predicted transcriptional regulator